MPKSISKATKDHEEIKHWVEKHNGHPACVRGTGTEVDPGILRIDFPGGSGPETFLEISWDEWFQKFDQTQLTFLYQEKKVTGEESTFFKLIKDHKDNK